MSGARTEDVRWELSRRDGWRCHYCLRLLAHSTATLEHVVPRAWGGQSGLRNLVMACQRCNGTRGSELVVCPCPFCVAARLHWVNHHASRAARHAVAEGRLDLRAGAGAVWLDATA